MIDFNTELGKRAWQRIAEEEIIWLTSVSSLQIPQPRPVWFVWDQECFLIYSQPTSMKVRQIMRNPNIALHFNADAKGGDVQVFLGKAWIDLSAPMPAQMSAYVEKYEAGMRAIQMTPDRYSELFSTAIRVQPTKLRSVDTLPE
ncbi:MAG: TIGR03667 family PPOX class F420-dependent oxidoreductase [Caldilineaceae bacterium]